MHGEREETSQDEKEMSKTSQSQRKEDGKMFDDGSDDETHDMDDDDANESADEEMSWVDDNEGDATHSSSEEKDVSKKNHKDDVIKFKPGRGKDKEIDIEELKKRLG